MSAALTTPGLHHCAPPVAPSEAVDPKLSALLARQARKVSSAVEGAKAEMQLELAVSSRCSLPEDAPPLEMDPVLVAKLAERSQRADVQAPGATEPNVEVMPPTANELVSVDPKVETSTTQAATPVSVAAIETLWTEVVAEDGRIYYWNQETDETSWFSK